MIADRPFSPVPRLGDVDAEDRGEHADGGHHQREQQTLHAECGGAQDQRGDQGHRVGLEQVGGHTGAVTHVVADVVGDGGGVARVILGDVLLDLADQVGADIGGLGEDAAANSHEHGEQRGTEAEALQHLGGLAGVGEHHDRGTEQAEADGHHADDATGAERDLHALFAALVVGGRGDAHVRPRGQPHTEITDGRGERGTDQEEDGAADALADRVGGECEQQQEHDYRENRERTELPVEVCRRALLDRLGDLLHLRGALASGQHPLEQDIADDQSNEGDDSDHGENAAVTPGQHEAVREGLGHPSSWWLLPVLRVLAGNTDRP